MLPSIAGFSGISSSFPSSAINIVTYALRPRQKRLVIGVAATGMKITEKPESYTIWKSYIKASACCCSFKGSHYIPVSKTVAFCVITQTPHSSAPSFLSWYPSPLIYFSSELIIVWLMGFWNGMWRGCGTGPGHGVTPLSAVSRLWLGPSSRLNDFPGELWFWHWVRLCLLSHTDVWRLPDPSASCPGDWAVGRWCIFYH